MTVHVVNHRIAFRCQFKSNGTTENCVFEVTWYHNSKGYKIGGTTILRGNSRVAELTNTHKRFSAIGRMYFLGEVVIIRRYVNFHILFLHRACFF